MGRQRNEHVNHQRRQCQGADQHARDQLQISEQRAQHKVEEQRHREKRQPDRHGLDTDLPADGVPNQYLSATAIRALDAALVLAGATPQALQRDLHRRTHWKRVCSVKLALLLHGDTNTRADRVALQFDLFGPAYAGSSDVGTRILEAEIPEAERWRARRLFGLTVALRNKGG